MKLDKTLRAYGAELVKRYREKAGKRGAPARTIPVRGSARSPQAIGTRAKRVDAATGDLTPELEASFVRRGLSVESARVAARGRARSSAGSLIEAGQRLGLMPAAAHTFARGRHGLREAVKNVAGLPASCFAWVPDPEDPTTWQLQISRSVDTGNGEWLPDEDLVRAAVAQLPGLAGYGDALDIPAGDLPGVKSILRSAWIACGAALDEMPLELTQEALRRSFRRLGLSETAAAVAASGRGRRL